MQGLLVRRGTLCHCLTALSANPRWRRGESGARAPARSGARAFVRELSEGARRGSVSNRAQKHGLGQGFCRWLKSTRARDAEHANGRRTMYNLARLSMSRQILDRPTTPSNRNVLDPRLDRSRPARIRPTRERRRDVHSLVTYRLQGSSSSGPGRMSWVSSSSTQGVGLLDSVMAIRVRR